MNTDIEVWRPIDNFPGYWVSNTGLVMSSGHGENKVLSATLSSKGYLFVSLQRNKKSRSEFCYIHRLVAEAFLPNPNRFPEVNHKDEVTINNYVTNLEWCTTSYNLNYGTSKERKKIAMLKNRYGKNWKNFYDISGINERCSSYEPRYYCIELERAFYVPEEAELELEIPCLSNKLKKLPKEGSLVAGRIDIEETIDGIDTIAKDVLLHWTYIYS